MEFCDNQRKSRSLVNSLISHCERFNLVGQRDHVNRRVIFKIHALKESVRNGKGGKALNILVKSFSFARMNQGSLIFFLRVSSRTSWLSGSEKSISHDHPKIHFRFSKKTLQEQ